MEINKILLILICLKINTIHKINGLRAMPRTLTFPVTAPTRIQFICGIGIPYEDLVYESVTSGYVLKAEYFLPERADEFTHLYLRPQTIDRRSIRADNAMEDTENLLNSTKLLTTTQQQQQFEYHQEQKNKSWSNGHFTEKRSSNTDGDNFKSQHKHASFYRWHVYKSIEMILNSGGLPGRECLLRTLCDHASLPLHYESGILAELLHIILTPSTSLDEFADHRDSDYLAAEILGRSDGDCERKYSKCPKSPIDQISAIFDLDVEER